MTVAELKKILEKYNDEDIVEIDGGNGSYGPSMYDYAELSINGDTILELE
jgi:hypothetical protein